MLTSELSAEDLTSFSILERFTMVESSKGDPTSLSYQRPQTGHPTPGATSKMTSRGSCHVLRPAGHGFAKAAQRSVRLFCHKGALQTCAPFVHHSIGVARALSRTAALWERPQAASW